MKSIFIKLTFSLTLILSINCKSQTVLDYVNFYNEITPKLNVLADNKSQYIGQNFSLFNNAIYNNNISIISIGYHSKVASSKRYYILALEFCNDDLFFIGLDNEYQVPVVYVTFENEIPSSIKSMVLQYKGEWNSAFEQFFANMKIEKIKFTGVNGYYSNNRTPK